jgi:PIN domain nuclease of toxin-antitoxin system
VEHRVKLLLDTHAVLFWANDDPILPRKARRVISSASNECFISSASVWEVAMKTKSGKMDAYRLLETFETFVRDNGFYPLSITLQHARAAGALPLHHKDPFDRMLAAQAQLEQLTLISKDEVFDSYGVQRLW